MAFPNDFRWGVVSASYQVEGAVQEDGRGPSIWDTFSHQPDKIYNDQNGDIACDHYHRYREDVGLMAELGTKHYRFSVSWSRILPTGRGEINQKGLEFYDNLVNALLEKGIVPYVTLYHWDLPQALEDEGGWLNESTVDAFEEYATIFVRHFKGRVKNYFTLNEPQITLHNGYVSLLHAPGKPTTVEEQFKIARNLLLAHGRGVKAIRGADNNALVGMASTGKLCYSLSKKPEDIEAAEFATFNYDDRWAFTHTWFLDAAVLDKYPAEPFFERFTAMFSEDDRRIINQNLDYFGANIYNGSEVVSDGNGSYTYVPRHDGFARSALKWVISPEVMHYGVNALYNRYKLPIFISENGQSCNDRIYLDGKVHDPDRIDFLTRYLRELKKSIDDGSEIIGYFQWSFTDNFEWHSGYDDRFGLVYIDYPTQRRIPKDSFYWYADLIKSNGGIISQND